MDDHGLHDLWRRAVAAGAVDGAGGPPSVVEPFGDSPELADELLALVLIGRKRATASSLAEYEHLGEQLPEVGRMWVVTDGHDRARALLRTTDVRIGPLSSVDDQFAWDEGEGDRTRADWLRTHVEFFSRLMPTIGEEFHDDMPVVFERFEVVYAE